MKSLECDELDALDEYWAEQYEEDYVPNSSRELTTKNSLFTICVMMMLISVFFGMVGVASATDYYVATWGSNSNPGTLAEPWETIEKANQELQAGDTVFMREGNYKETIDPSSSGTEGNCITYQNYANEEPILSHVTAHDKCAIYLNNREYIVIDGITVDGYVDGYPDVCPSVKRWIWLHGGGHNIIQNCKLQYSGTGWGGVDIVSSHYNKILNNTIHHCGSFDEITWDGVTLDDYGDAIFMYNTRYNLIEGNDVSYGGHTVLDLNNGKYNIIRNNYFHNPWEKCLDILQIGETECKHNLIENNVIAFAYKWNDAGTYPNPGVSCASKHAIVRNNVFHSNSAEGFWIDNWGTCPYSEGHRIYNNVFYHNGHHDMPVSHNTYGFLFARWGGNPIVNNVLINNIFGDNNLGSIRWSGVDPAKQVVEYNYEENPLFVDALNYDFHLRADSPCINTGRHLTKTIGSGSGTQLTVEDAGYFCDGFDIIEGDLIQVGSNSPVRITNVDYDNNKITVERSISWNNNDGVSLPYSGSAPDIGAYEFRRPIATGTIVGTIKDTSGNPIQGVTVTVNGLSVTTDATGSYIIRDISLGTYTVKASKTGYFPESQENVEVLENGTTVNFQLIEAPDLVGLWHFDEGLGTTAYDSSECGNDGTLVNGPAWVDGVVDKGKALSFDGIDDYVEVADDASLGITEAITIITWVYPTASSYGQWDAILGKGNSAYRLHMHDNQFDFGLSIDELPNQNLDAGITFAQNQWTHVAATYDGTIMKIYINGTLANSKDVSGDIKTNNYHLWIGGNSQVPDKHFNGTIDEVTIYGRALSAEEIKSDYEEGVDNTYPRYDVNEDGKVDILDTTIVAQHYGETTNPSYPRYDVNEDGRVDISDTTIVGQHLGEITS